MTLVVEPKQLQLVSGVGVVTTTLALLQKLHYMLQMCHQERLFQQYMLFKNCSISWGQLLNTLTLIHLKRLTADANFCHTVYYKVIQWYIHTYYLVQYYIFDKAGRMKRRAMKWSERVAESVGLNAF